MGFGWLQREERGGAGDLFLLAVRRLCSRGTILLLLLPKVGMYCIVSVEVTGGSAVMGIPCLTIPCLPAPPMCRARRQASSDVTHVLLGVPIDGANPLSWSMLMILIEMN